MSAKTREPVVFLFLTAVALGVSGVGCIDPFTWFMEIVPILIVAPILIVSYKGFPLTPFLYRFMFLHGLILMLGGHYTYAEVPLGYWMESWFGFTRNNYDKIGHFAQGFVPALAVRELFIRHKIVESRTWRFFIVTSVCLAFSAFYEFIEWWTALATGEGAEAFLGTQGDPWDTQSDMFLAFLGALLAQLVLGRLQDRQIREITQAP